LPLPTTIVAIIVLTIIHIPIARHKPARETDKGEITAISPSYFEQVH
jgi:hypothetical protein